MLITLFLSDKVLYYRLPIEPSGSFSFYPDNEEEKLINVECVEGKWIFYSTSDSEIISNGVSIETAELVSNSFYVLKRYDVSYLVYVSDYKLNDMYIYSYKDAFDFEVSSSDNAGITYKCPCITDTTYKFTKKDNYITLHKAGKAAIYINGFAYNQDDIYVSYGDVINIYGLKIIFLKDKMLVSMIPNKVSLNEAVCSVSRLVKQNEENLNDYEIRDIDLYTSNDFYSKSPRLRRQITTKEIKLSNPPQIQEQKSSLLLVIELLFILTPRLPYFIKLYTY